jgi:hypothetical protein
VSRRVFDNCKHELYGAWTSSVADFTSSSIEQGDYVNRVSPSVQVGVVALSALNLHDSENVSPLSFGNCVPQLVKQRVFWAHKANRHRPSFYVELFRPSALEFLARPGVMTGHENFRLEHGCQMDNVDGGSAPDCFSDHIAIYLKFLGKSHRQRLNLFEAEIGHEIHVLRCTRDPIDGTGQ